MIGYYLVEIVETSVKIKLVGKIVFGPTRPTWQLGAFADFQIVALLYRYLVSISRFDPQRKVASGGSSDGGGLEPGKIVKW